MISVFGNGESRKNLNLNCFIETKIGCNAIHRDYYVEHLVCVDRRMVQEALDTEFKGIIYTRKEWSHFFKNNPVTLLPDLPYTGNTRPDEPSQWGSGPYAVLLGATLDNNINLFGFDLHSPTRYVNNIYKDTANYDAATKPAIDPRYWIYQISKVFLNFPDKYFTVYNIEGWEPPESWILANVLFKTLDNLE
jgi:hypothetical protein